MQDRGVGGASLNLKPPDQVLGTQLQDRRVKPQSEQPQKCPRCDSFNTKFCYYNNYSLSQPRYLCKTCRRYWTKGGTLRNVPVGGGCRKGSKRPRKTISDGPSNPSTHHQIGEAVVFPTLPFGAITSQFLLNQSSIGVISPTHAKVSERIPPFLAHPQYSHGLTLGDYNTIFGSGHHASLLPNAIQHAPPLPNSEGFVNEIEQWRGGDPADHGSMTKDGWLHLLPPFETTAMATSGGGNEAAVVNVPSLAKPEQRTAFEGNNSASSAGFCYWNNTSGTSLVGGNWQEFSGYGPSSSFL